MCEQTSFLDILNVTSSQASGGGQSPSPSQDGPAQSGPGHAPASRSASPANTGERPTSDTSGPSSGGSSRSAALQSCLESRLRVRLEGRGSPEYRLTWKHWDMQWGVPMCALRASVRRKSDSASGGWPTASSRDWKDTPGMATEATNPDGSTRKRVDQLPRVALLAGWPAPRTVTGGAESAQRKQELGRTRSGGGDLQAAALQAGMDPRCGTPAPTEDSGEYQLNPRFSLWLQGYPSEWASCGVRAMRLSRR